MQSVPGLNDQTVAWICSTSKSKKRILHKVVIKIRGVKSIASSLLVKWYLWNLLLLKPTLCLFTIWNSRRDEIRRVINSISLRCRACIRNETLWDGNINFFSIKRLQRFMFIYNVIFPYFYSYWEHIDAVWSFNPGGGDTLCIGYGKNGETFYGNVKEL